MIFFYSGNSKKDVVPEALMIEKPPGIMLTYHDMHAGIKDTIERFSAIGTI